MFEDFICAECGKAVPCAFIVLLCNDCIEKVLKKVRPPPAIPAAPLQHLSPVG